MSRTAGQTRKDQRTTSPGSPREDEGFALASGGTFILRLLRRYPHLFETALGPLFEMLPTAKSEAILFCMNHLADPARDMFVHNMMDDDSADNVAEAVRFHFRTGNARLRTKLKRLLLEGLAIAVEAQRERPRSRLEANLRRLREMFGLADREAEAFLFMYLVQANSAVNSLFHRQLDCNDLKGRPYVAAALGLEVGAFVGLLNGKLSQCGLMDGPFPWDASGYFVALLQNPDLDHDRNLMFRQARLRAIPLDYHLAPPRVSEHLRRLLQSPGKDPVHILLYGAAGTGKTSFARGLAKLVGLPTYEILTNEDNRNQDRRKAITTCLALTNHGDGSIVIVDEADNILNTQFSWLSQGESRDKGWLNQLLDTPGARVIWVTNSIHSMEESVQRRFAFSMAFRPLDLHQRAQIWQRVLRRNGVRRLLSDKEAHDLALRFKASPGVIDSVVRQAKRSAGGDRDGFKEALQMALEANLTLSRGGLTVRDRDRVEEAYDIQGLNLDCDLPALLSRLENLDRHLRQGDRDLNLSMNLLFHGPPGTGKSELARYMGLRLGREVLVRRGSDLLSMWVGETEKAIAAAFDQAEREEAVLVIDEADGFLFSRDKAIRSWEAGQVNEFLTQMERFRGILICTTNRLRDLDPASVRRFSEKVHFDLLAPQGVVLFYARLLEPLAACPLSEATSSTLRHITGLAPGDFRVVRDRYRLLEQAQRRPEAMVADLAREAALKEKQQGKKVVGFGSFFITDKAGR